MVISKSWLANALNLAERSNDVQKQKEQDIAGKDFRRN
jgi:hypothetical protein